MTMRSSLATGLVLVMLAGPLDAQEARHKGRTIAQWAEQLRTDNSEAGGKAAIDALVSFGARAVPTLIPMLRDPDSRVRFAVVWTLYLMGPRAAKQALPELCRIAAKDSHEELTIYAGSIITPWLVGPVPQLPLAESVPVLLRATQDPDADLRQAAARYLAAIVQHTPVRYDPSLTSQIVPALIQTLREPDAELRREAVAALGTLGPPARAAVPALQRLARDDPDSRHQAETALRSIEDR